MKTITFSVEITAEIHDWVDPDSVFFDLDYEHAKPMAYCGGHGEPQTIGKIVNHDTVAHFNDK